MRLQSIAKNGLIAAFTLSLVGLAWGGVMVESRSDERGYRGQTEEHNPSLDLLKKMEFLQQEVQELRGRVEEQNYQLTQLQEQQKKLYLDLDQRLKGGQAAQSPSSGVSLDDTVQPQAPTKANDTTTAAGLSEEKIYQDAYHAIQNKDYDAALIGFETVARDYPHGKYAANAHYWLGEIYVTKGKTELAASAFNQVYTQFPKHPKSADALLKLGLLEYTKGNWKACASYLNKVKTQYPGTTSAQLAEAKLAKLKQESKI